MRRLEPGPVLKVRAIAGLPRGARLGFFQQLSVAGAALPPELKDLLGFAIEREELDGMAPSSSDTCAGHQTLQVQAGLAAGTPVPLDEHPVQSFSWGDYTAKPATTYAYRVIPMYGDAQELSPSEASGRQGTHQDGTGGHDSRRHDARRCYFNRGVIGSQAYARSSTTGARRERPDPREMKWLSRGLFEALFDSSDGPTTTARRFAPPSMSSTTSRWPTRSARRSRPGRT